MRDYASVFQVHSVTSRGSASWAAGRSISRRKCEAYAELGYTRNETKYVFQEPFFTGNPTATTRL